jgi:hypothetical protein
MTKTRMVLTMAAALALGACDAGTVAGPDARSGGARFVDDQCPSGQVCWEPPPGDTTTPTPKAEYRYYSGVDGSVFGSSKSVSMGGVSESIRNVASLTLDTRFYFASICASNPPQVARQTKSGTGSPKMLVTSWGITYSASAVYSFGVRSTHSFTAVPGATGGGGPFTSNDGGCY